MATAEGGYDANFVEEVATDIKCVVCHFPLRKPVQVIQCGHRFCEECFEQMKDYSSIRDTDLCCPLDRMVINSNQVFPHKGLERTILSLKVRCSNVAKGCIWVNDLRDLQKDGDYNGKEIKKIIEGLLSSRLEEFEIKIKERDDRLTMTEKRLASCEKNLKITTDRLRNCKEESLKKDAIIERLSYVNSMGFFQWTLNNYNSVKWGEDLDSPYFYSSYHGYKCQLSARWYGPRKGRMGLYFHLCKGENDEELVWPFPMKVRWQSTDSNGVIRSVTSSYLTANYPVFWDRPEGVRNTGIGSEHFLHMPQLEKHIRNNKMVVYCFFDQ